MSADLNVAELQGGRRCWGLGPKGCIQKLTEQRGNAAQSPSKNETSKGRERNASCCLCF